MSADMIRQRLQRKGVHPQYRGHPERIAAISKMAGSTSLMLSILAISSF
jgi:hypothetical protein